MSRRPRYEALAPNGARIAFRDLDVGLKHVHASGLEPTHVEGEPEDRYAPFLGLDSTLRWLFEPGIVRSVVAESELMQLFRPPVKLGEFQTELAGRRYTVTAYAPGEPIRPPLPEGTRYIEIPVWL